MTHPKDVQPEGSARVERECEWGWECPERSRLGEAMAEVKTKSVERRVGKSMVSQVREKKVDGY